MVSIFPILSKIIIGVLLVGGVFAIRRLIHNVCFFFSVDESAAHANLGAVLYKSTQIMLGLQCVYIVLMLTGLGTAAPDLSGGVVVLCFYTWLGMLYTAIILRKTKSPTLLRLFINFIMIIIQAISWLFLAPWDFAPFG